jgi:hypothetical protein
MDLGMIQKRVPEAQREFRTNCRQYGTNPRILNRLVDPFQACGIMTPQNRVSVTAAGTSLTVCA